MELAQVITHQVITVDQVRVMAHLVIMEEPEAPGDLVEVMAHLAIVEDLVEAMVHLVIVEDLVEAMAHLVIVEDLLEAMAHLVRVEDLVEAMARLVIAEVLVEVMVHLVIMENLRNTEVKQAAAVVQDHTLDQALAMVEPYHTGSRVPEAVVDRDHTAGQVPVVVEVTIQHSTTTSQLPEVTLNRLLPLVVVVEVVPVEHL